MLQFEAPYSRMNAAMKSMIHLAQLLVLSGAVGILLPGCETTPKTGSLTQAIADYNAQRYAQSHERAASIMASARGTEREQAAYIAGLSAYRLGQFDEAERRLLVAAQATDPQIAAKSKAMLGQVRMEQGRPREAATYFADAARGLAGEDARQCAHHAAVAYQQCGDVASSRYWQAEAQRIAASSTSLATAAGHHTSGSVGFTLQAGAFEDQRRAQRAADQIKSLAVREGLGEVRIVPHRDARGKRLYLVQFGFFTTRSDAAEARNRLGRLELIVTPVSGHSL